MRVEHLNLLQQDDLRGEKSGVEQSQLFFAESVQRHDLRVGGILILVGDG